MADIQALLAIMARLRDPRGGCPWDLKQNFASISPHTIEEAYEVDEAIAQGDLEALRDELGDLLFQVVFQARLAEEQGAFDFSGVVGAIVEKLVRRHPHVFADAEVPSTAEAQRASWEAIKAEERAARRGEDRPPDPFEGIPRRLPALARSAKLAHRIERLSREPQPVVAPPSSSDSELIESLSKAVLRLESGLTKACTDEATGVAPASVDVALGESDGLRRLVGEGICGWVRVATRLGIDPEQALRLVDDETVAEILSNAHQASSSSRR